MKKMIVKTLLLSLMAIVLTRCKDQVATESKSTSTTVTAAATTLTGVAATSGQLASGTSFSVPGTTSDSTMHPGGPMPGGGNCGGPLDGTNLLAPTNQLLAIIDAESAGDFRGMRMQAAGGATVTNYDQSGNIIALPLPASGGPQGCSFSGGQFPHYDSLLALIAKTVIDFGSGVTEKHDTTTITRVGEIIITRSTSSSTKTEVITFENYSVNGNSIAGTKTRVSSYVRSDGTEKGTSTTSVSGGKITFSDGTVGVWTGSKQRNSSITYDSTRRPLSGEITTQGGTAVTGSDGTIIYSDNITKAITENIACGPQHHGPVSGTVETIYGTNTIIIDFGDGTCSDNSITITINGVATTKTVGG